MTYIERADNFMNGLGIEVYRVGGSVRDEILGRRPKDADYVARGIALAPLMRLLKRTEGAKVTMITDRNGRPLGARARVDKLHVEVTLPRKEVKRPRCNGRGEVYVGSPGDYASPGESYAPCAGCSACGKATEHTAFDIVMDPLLPLAEDAKRRDFTFNALYRQVGPVFGDVADPTNRGLYDLQHRFVHTTYRTSFRDDPLRILRALRFVSVLGYDLTGETLNEMREYAADVTGLTAKNYASGTVFEEMSKLLMGDNVAKALRLAASTGVLGTLFPELAPMIGFDQGSRYHDMTTDEHTFTALHTSARCEAPPRVRWALLFHDAGKPETAWVGEDGRKHYYAQKPKDEVIDPVDGHLNLDHEEQSEFLWRGAAERLNLPARLREDVAKLVRHHMLECSGKVKGSKVRRRRVQLGDELLRDLHMHRMCDLSAKGKPSMTMIAHVAEQENLRRYAKMQGVPASVLDLQIGGEDAMMFGLTGHAIGEALRGVLDEVAVDPSPQRMSREWQLKALERRVA